MSEFINGWYAYSVSMLWQSSLLMIAVWCIVFLCRKRSASLRYGLLCLILLKFLLPTNLHVVTGVGHWAGSLPKPFPEMERPYFSDLKPQIPAPEQAPIQTSRAVESVEISIAQQSPKPLSKSFLFFWIWVCGVLMLGLALAVYAVRVRRAFAGAVVVEDNEVLALLRRCREEMGIRREVPLLSVTSLGSPVLAGLLRPRILIDSRTLAEKNLDILRPILLHELAHLKRFDLWINALQAVLQVVWFYHPGLLLTNWFIRREREKACDDVVLAKLEGSRGSYVESIMSVLKNTRTASISHLGLLGIAEKPSAIKARLRRIMNPKHKGVLRVGLLGNLLLVLLAAVLLPMAKGETNKETVTEPSASNVEASSSSRVLQFPEDRSLGLIQVRDSASLDEFGWRSLADAKGRVVIPAGKEALLMLESAASNDLSPLRNLKPDDLYGVGNEFGTPLSQENLLCVTSLSGLKNLQAEVPADVGSFFEALSTLPSLKDLTIRSGLLSKVPLDDLHRLQSLKSLESLSISQSGIDDEWIQALPPLASLKTLSLRSYSSEDRITNECLSSIARFSLLRSLDLCGSSQTQITDDGLSLLSGLGSLERLSIDSSGLTNAGLANLASFRSLKSVYFRNLSLNDEGLKHLKELKTQEKLILSDDITEKGVEYLSEFPSLKAVVGASSDAALRALENTTTLMQLDAKGDRVTDVGMASIAKMTSLEYLGLLNCQVTEAGWAHLAPLVKLNQLSLGGRMTGNGLQVLGKLPALRSISLSSIAAAEEELRFLKSVDSLESLCFYKMPLTDRVLEHLSILPRFEFLCADSYERITDEGMVKLASKGRLTHLQLPGRETTTLTDRSLKSLAKCGKLKDLFVSGHFTDDGLNSLNGLKCLDRLGVTGTEMTASGAIDLVLSIPSLRSFSLRNRIDGVNSEILTDNLFFRPDQVKESQTKQEIVRKEFRGKVVAKDTGKTVPNALLRITIPRWRSMRMYQFGEREVACDAKGEFQFVLPVPVSQEEYELTFDAFYPDDPGFRQLKKLEKEANEGVSRVGRAAPHIPSSERKVQVKPGVSEDLTLEVETPVYVAGVVVDESGEPLSGILVGASVSGQGLGDEQTGPRGEFEIVFFPPESRAKGKKGYLFFTSKEYLPQTVGDIYALSLDERKTIKVVMSKGYSISGRLLDSKGNPSANTPVKASLSDRSRLRSIETDSEGSFALCGLPAEKLNLRAHAMLIREKASQSIDLTRDIRNVELRMSPIVYAAEPQPISVLGMKMVEVNKELQEIYDLWSDNGLLILDPGKRPDRLGIHELHEGSVLSRVGKSKITSLRQFVEETLRLDKMPSSTRDSYLGRSKHQIEIGYSYGDSSAAGWMNLTEADIAALEELLKTL